MPGLIEGQVTRDGRKRAPRHVFGANHIKPYPWLRIGLGLGVLYFAWSAAYKRYSYVSPQEQFVRKIRIRPYGVLGTQMSLTGSVKREAPEPDDTVVITDPSDLMAIYTTASKATGTSGAIYKWLGLKGKFPDDVVLSVSKVSDAKHHCYGGDERTKEGGRHIIHVADPDFREGVWSEREAAIELSRAYRNTFHEFAVSECATLRMVPFSEGSKSGALYDQMGPITHEALLLAFDQLHVFDKEYVLRHDKTIELCVFANREWDKYKNAFEHLQVHPTA